MVESATTPSPTKEAEEAPKPKLIKAAPGEAEIRLTQLDIKMKTSLEDH